MNENLAEDLEALVEKSRVDLLRRELDAKEKATALIAAAATAIDLGSPVAARCPLTGAKQESEQLVLHWRMALQLGDVNDALDFLDEANRDGNNHSRAVYWLAVAEHRKGSVQQAQTRLDDYLKANPANPDARHFRVQLARRETGLKESALPLQKGLHLD